MNIVKLSLNTHYTLFIFGACLFLSKKYVVDEIDLQILNILEDDSKTNYREIAKKINKAVGTVHNRITNLIEQGIIKRFTIHIDTLKIGYEITAIILLQILGESIQEIEVELLEKEIHESHDVPCYLFEGNRKGRKNQADKLGRHWLCKNCHDDYEKALRGTLIDCASKFSKIYSKLKEGENDSIP